MIKRTTKQTNERIWRILFTNLLLCLEDIVVQCSRRLIIPSWWLWFRVTNFTWNVGDNSGKHKNKYQQRKHFAFALVSWIRLLFLSAKNLRQKSGVEFIRAFGYPKQNNHECIGNFFLAAHRLHAQCLQCWHGSKCWQDSMNWQNRHSLHNE